MAPVAGTQLEHSWSMPGRAAGGEHCPAGAALGPAGFGTCENRSGWVPASTNIFCALSILFQLYDGSQPPGLALDVSETCTVLFPV